MKFQHYLNEASEKGRSLLVFDIDETVFKTFAKIRVLDAEGNDVVKLSNAEFNAYKLKDGESFDFSEFRDATLFNQTSQPIRKMLAKVKALINNNAKVIFLTARTDFDDKDLFLQTFKKYGLDPDTFYVERAGNLSRGSVPERKMYIILKKYLSTGIYRRAYIYDDFLPNCTDFLALKNKIPEDVLNKIRQVNNITDMNEPPIVFKAYLVNGDGSTTEVK